MAARSLNGGLMELGQLRAAVLKRRGRTADPIADEDLLRAIDSLKCAAASLLLPDELYNACSVPVSSSTLSAAQPYFSALRDPSCHQRASLVSSPFLNIPRVSNECRLSISLHQVPRRWLGRA